MSPSPEIDDLLSAAESKSIASFIKAIGGEKEIDAAPAQVIIPKGLKKLSAFITASALDGEADARGEELAVARIARVAGVSRALIREWRGLEEYKLRRRGASVAWSANLAASPKAGAEEWEKLLR